MRHRSAFVLTMFSFALGYPKVVGAQIESSEPPDWLDCASTSGWVGEAAIRWTEASSLVDFATGAFGPGVCRGRVEDDFDGATYGTVQLLFGDDVSLSLTTMPIATSIRSLESARGFEQDAAIVAAFRLRAEEVGVEIDWETAEREEDAEGVVERFWDPSPGLNASVTFRYVGGRLVSATFSMAL